MGLLTGNEIGFDGLVSDLYTMPIVPTTYTASVNASRDDVGRVVFMNSGSALSYTVLQDSAMTRPIPNNSMIVLCQEGAGLLTLVQGSGVTITSIDGLVSRGAGAFIMLLKRSATTWIATGDLTT